MLCSAAAIGFCQCMVGHVQCHAPVDHHVTWQEFTAAFREYYIPTGVLNRKLTEFLDLKQGSMSVMDYVNKFNHLA